MGAEFSKGERRRRSSASRKFLVLISLPALLLEFRSDLPGLFDGRGSPLDQVRCLFAESLDSGAGDPWRSKTRKWLLRHGTPQKIRTARARPRPRTTSGRKSLKKSKDVTQHDPRVSSS